VASIFRAVRRGNHETSFGSGSTQPNALRHGGWPIISNFGLPPAVFFDGNGFYV
jgi:hypothetical protein